MKFVSEKKNKSVYKTYLVYFIALLSFVCVRIMSSIGIFSSLSNNSIDIIYSSIIELGCLFLIPLLLYCLFLKQKPKQVFKTCNFYKMSFMTILYSIILGFFIYFLTIVLSTFFNGILAILGYNSGSSSSTGEVTLLTYIIQIFTTAILPAFCEEFLHRGILLQGTKHIGFHKSIFISSVLFGLIHLNITQVFYAAILGFIMGYASVVAKNIWPAIIVHFMNNFISVTNSYLISTNTAYRNFMNGIYAGMGNMSFIILVLILSFGLLILIAIIYLLLNRLYYHGMIKKVENAVSKVYAPNGEAMTSSPIETRQEEYKYLLENTTTLNLDFNTIKNPIEILMPKQDKIYRQTYKDKIFLKSSIILGVVITIFTFVWGVM